MEVIDLTAPLAPSTVLWPGLPAVAFETTFSLDADGFYGRLMTLPEHSGTHLDAPAHFAAGGASVDGLPASRLVVPCAVIDVRGRCASDPDFALSREDVLAAEAEDGPLPAGGAVLLCTGWDVRAGSAGDWLGAGHPDRLSFPGFGASAAKLFVERGLVGIGIDTAGVDRGCDGEWPVHNTTLPAGMWHLEGLVDLASVPARGATLVVGAMKLADGSGAPARVFALVG